jgi:hypothetical protein
MVCPQGSRTLGCLVVFAEESSATEQVRFAEFEVGSIMEALVSPAASALQSEP